VNPIKKGRGAGPRYSGSGGGAGFVTTGGGGGGAGAGRPSPNKLSPAQPDRKNANSAEISERQKLFPIVGNY
jgi:hypothetical protein